MRTTATNVSGSRGFDAGRLALDQAAKHERSGESYRGACHCEHQAAAHDQTKYVGSTGAKGHPYTDFPRAFSHGVAHHGKDARDDQTQSDRSEQGQQRRIETGARRYRIGARTGRETSAQKRRGSHRADEQPLSPTESGRAGLRLCGWRSRRIATSFCAYGNEELRRHFLVLGSPCCTSATIPTISRTPPLASTWRPIGSTVGKPTAHRGLH